MKAVAGIVGLSDAGLGRPDFYASVGLGIGGMTLGLTPASLLGMQH
jgi:hypothetical protein